MSTVSLWTRRDPFAEFDDTFNALVRRAFGPMSARSAGHFVPPADITREGDDAVIRIEVPGLDIGKDVTVEIQHSHLIVRGEKRDERTEHEEGRTLREVRYGTFRREFTIPEHVTTESVSAAYDAGVLSVRITGAYAVPEPQVRKIAVTHGGPAQALESDTGASQPETQPEA